MNGIYVHASLTHTHTLAHAGTLCVTPCETGCGSFRSVLNNIVPIKWVAAPPGRIGSVERESLAEMTNARRSRALRLRNLHYVDWCAKQFAAYARALTVSLRKWFTCQTWHNGGCAGDVDPAARARGFCFCLVCCFFSWMRARKFFDTFVLREGVFDRKLFVFVPHFSRFDFK